MKKKKKDYIYKVASDKRILEFATQTGNFQIIVAGSVIDLSDDERKEVFNDLASRIMNIIPRSRFLGSLYTCQIKVSK